MKSEQSKYHWRISSYKHSWVNEIQACWYQKGRLFQTSESTLTIIFRRILKLNSTSFNFDWKKLMTIHDLFQDNVHNTLKILHFFSCRPFNSLDEFLCKMKGLKYVNLTCCKYILHEQLLKRILLLLHAKRQALRSRIKSTEDYWCLIHSSVTAVKLHGPGLPPTGDKAT